MPTLIILTAVMASLASEPTPAVPSLSLSPQGSTPPLLQGTSSRRLSAPNVPRFHPLDTVGKDPSSDRVVDRIFLEFLGGAGLGALGGGLTGWAMGSTLESPTSLLLPISVLLLGNGVGVTLVGTLMEGRGRFGYAMLGSILGSVVPLALGIGMMQFVNNMGQCFGHCAQPVIVSLLGLLVLPAVGAIVGYELSAPKSWLLLAHALESRPAPRQVVPVLSLAGQGLGGTVGLAWAL